jgi:hypothetical protein
MKHLLVAITALASAGLAVAGCTARPPRSEAVHPEDADVRTRGHDAGVAHATGTIATSRTSDRMDMASTKGPPDALDRARSARGRYVTPSPVERDTLREAMRALVAGDRSRAELFAAKVGFVVDALEPYPDLLLLRERDDARRGGGAYVLRTGCTSRLVVQAPHTLFDAHTLPIAWAVFARTHARALFVDTVHRYRGAEASASGDHPADVAHADDSLFHAATLGALDALRTPDVVQIHGFAPRSGGADVRAVVSVGVDRENLRDTALAKRALEEALRGPVLRFPDEIRELGATTNVQGRATRARGGRFLHVELGAEVRERAAEDSDTRVRIADAIVRALGGR